VPFSSSQLNLNNDMLIKELLSIDDSRSRLGSAISRFTHPKRDIFDKRPFAQQIREQVLLKHCRVRRNGSFVTCVFPNRLSYIQANQAMEKPML
jgi:hypothetical protein